VHRTVSGVPNFSTLKSFAPFLIVSLTGFLSWFMLNLMHVGCQPPKSIIGND
jgi:hypothetical protein